MNRDELVEHLYNEIANRDERIGELENDASYYASRNEELRAELSAIKAQGVVMPERANASHGSHDHQSGWNACLDEVARLNAAPAPAGVTPHEENHHQKALALYSLILSNVEELAQSIVKGKRPDEKYIDSARIGVMQAHIERLCAMLPDWQIEAMLERMQGFQEKTLDKE